MPALDPQPKADASLETKELPAQHHGDGDDDGDAQTEYIEGYSKSDRKDMRRMGKKQELMRNFRRLSAFSFTVMLTATWEYLLMYVRQRWITHLVITDLIDVERIRKVSRMVGWRACGGVFCGRLLGLGLS
jgi:hypothetical protein